MFAAGLPHLCLAFHRGIVATGWSIAANHCHILQGWGYTFYATIVGLPRLSLRAIGRSFSVRPGHFECWGGGAMWRMYTCFEWGLVERHKGVEVAAMPATPYNYGVYLDSKQWDDLLAPLYTHCWCNHFNCLSTFLVDKAAQPCFIELSTRQLFTYTVLQSKEMSLPTSRVQC